MALSDVKKLVAEKFGWNTADIFYLFYLTTDNQFSYYIVSKNHCIRNVIALDELNRCVSNIWS